MTTLQERLSNARLRGRMKMARALGLGKIADDAWPITIPVKERATDPKMEPIRVKSDVGDAFKATETFDQAKPGNIGEPGTIHRHMG